MTGEFICGFADIPDNSGRGFEAGGLSLVVVRQGEKVFAYRNVCPHRGTPLNWMPDQFMNYDRRYIQCSTHGALFEPGSGLCVAGPCSGDYLQALPVKVVRKQVFLA